MSLPGFPASDSSPRADAAASLSRPRAGRLLDLRPVASLAGVGLLGSSPFTLAGDPTSATLLPTGELTLDGLTGEAPAGIGVLESGPIGSGNQVAVDVGEVSPSVPVTACGNGVGLLGDVSAACGSDTSTGGIIAPTPEPPGGTDTGTSGTSGIPGNTGTSGLLATTGLTPGTSGDPIASFAPLHPLADSSGALPFTGAASDLLAVAGAGLLAAGFLVVRATRPDTAGKGGGDR